MRLLRAIGGTGPMMQRCEIAVIGSGFAGSLMARVLARLGRDVVLLERDSHPRFAIGESSTPLANLSLERLARRYNMPDCYRLATHGRWLEHHSNVRRGLKRGFTFYRHHPGRRIEPMERLLVAASPDDRVSDTHWLRADVDHHFVREAIAAGVHYSDHTRLTHAHFDASGVTLRGERHGMPVELRADFLIDASGPGGFLARQLAIPSALERTLTRSSILFSHFADVHLMSDVLPDLPEGPYPDDWAAVHHLIDEGWMYALRFDHGVVSAGFVLRPSGGHDTAEPEVLWRALVAKYPSIDALFGDATPTIPLAYRAAIQHRLARAAGDRWVMLPHAFAFVDPLFSTGIAWSLRATERLALCFESSRLPDSQQLARYDALLAKEADQIDRMVAGAYEAMAHFDLFAAHAMIYFASVSFSEVRQRIVSHDDDAAAWSGFLGVDDDVLEALPDESLTRLRRLTRGGSPEGRADYVDWMRRAIASRNIGGFGDPARRNLYPVDLDRLVANHDVLALTRDDLVAALPALRGMAPEPAFA